MPLTFLILSCVDCSSQRHKYWHRMLSLFPYNFASYYFKCANSFCMSFLQHIVAPWQPVPTKHLNFLHVPVCPNNRKSLYSCYFSDHWHFSSLHLLFFLILPFLFCIFSCLVVLYVSFKDHNMFSWLLFSISVRSLNAFPIYLLFLHQKLFNF